MDQVKINLIYAAERYCIRKRFNGAAVQIGPLNLRARSIRHAASHDPASEAPWTSRGDPKARPVRGGSWHDTPDACRSAARARYDAGQGDDFVGFRVLWQPAE